MDDQVKLIFIVGNSREVKKDEILVPYVILNNIPFALFVYKFSYVFVLNKNHSTSMRPISFMYVYH